MTIAFIPVRGGSKSIPLKNIKTICGKPLVYWTAKAACGCRYIDRVYIATDSDLIRKAVEDFSELDTEMFGKLEVVGRSAESASDNASTEFAMLEFAANYDFDDIVLVQATSPMLTSDDLNGGMELYHSENTDSVLSCVRQYRFLWSETLMNEAHPINYDIFNRPRRQEFGGYLMENGAFYITSREFLLASRNRMSGKIKAYEMSAATAFEIDEPSDWIIVEELMKRRQEASFDFSQIKMFLTDCDGCLTDGGMYYSEKGDELKKFNTKDGMAFSLLKEAGIITGIVTGESVNLNVRRADKIAADILKTGCKDKLSTIASLCMEKGIGLKNVAYIGDDLNDVETMSAVGWSCAPADASEEAKAVSKYIAKNKGGQGVIREAAEIILKNM